MIILLLFCLVWSSYGWFNFCYYILIFLNNFLINLKSLLRFKCVSKSWRCLISDKAFIENHLKKSMANGENTDCNKLLCSFWDPTTELLRLFSCSLRDEPIIMPDLNFDDCNIPGGGMCFSMVGSCNGLILVDTVDALFIWNPSTRRVIKEFKPPSFDGRRLLDSPYSYGLGYDESTGDYKVVCTHKYKTHMYSCSTDSWKEIQTRSDKVFWLIHRPAKFVNGRFHWLAGEEGIVSLRLSDEKFENELIPCPAQHQSGRAVMVRVEDFGGYLSLYCQALDTMKLNVWAMMEYGVTESWAKVFTLGDFFDSPWEFLMFKGLTYPLCLKKNGDITVAFVSGDIVVYNGEQELRKYRVHMVDARLDFVVYVESLV